MKPIKYLYWWMAQLLSGQPHFIIGNPSHPYLLRWFIIPRNQWFNIYLHKFCRDDIDRALHDHPWLSVSIGLRGRYIERYEVDGIEQVRTIRPWRVIYRSATFRHRIILHRRYTCGQHVEYIEPVPAWTLFMTGPRVRDWYFHCEQGPVLWDQFVDRDNPGAVGAGCGETDQ